MQTTIRISPATVLTWNSRRNAPKSWNLQMLVRSSSSGDETAERPPSPTAPRASHHRSSAGTPNSRAPACRGWPPRRRDLAALRTQAQSTSAGLASCPSSHPKPLLISIPLLARTSQGIEFFQRLRLERNAPWPVLVHGTTLERAFRSCRPVSGSDRVWYHPGLASGRVPGNRKRCELLWLPFMRPVLTTQSMSSTVLN